ncbi:MAG: DUF6090 family protein [Psychroserpens sp.]|uniref:DUF6090 family protein n=1 Tax=Psychroserpens sp. TaxID=2020870 RepID=UPI003003A03B
MIKFFRKIRHDLMEQNKTGKYFKYAIGEIILVVIGILIALQINNWSEGIKNGNTEQEFYKEILSDLEKDNIKLEGLTEFYNNRIEHAGWLLKKVRKPIGSINKLEFGQHVEPLYIGPIPVIFNSSFEAAKSSGAFALFENKEILKQLNQYYTNFEELKGIMAATLRFLETRLEPIMATVPINYVKKETGVYVITSELQDLKELYTFLDAIKDERKILVDLNVILQNPAFESYLSGDLGRSFNALTSIEIRKEQLNKIKTEIKHYVSN